MLRTEISGMSAHAGLGPRFEQLPLGYHLGGRKPSLRNAACGRRPHKAEHPFNPTREAPDADTHCIRQLLEELVLSPSIARNENDFTTRREVSRDICVGRGQDSRGRQSLSVAKLQFPIGTVAEPIDLCKVSLTAKDLDQSGEVPDGYAGGCLAASAAKSRLLGHQCRRGLLGSAVPIPPPRLRAFSPRHAASSSSSVTYKRL